MHKIFTNSLFVGKKVIHLPKCHSTNSIAAGFVTSGQAYEGTVIITDHQTAGRGQRGSVWESEPGENLTFSVILNPIFLTPHQQFFLTIVSSLAVYNIVKKEVEDAKIKWPNDIYCGHKKIGGILIENSVKRNKIETSVVGIGLNVNQLNFSIDSATSLQIVTGRKFDKAGLLEGICYHLETAYLQLRAGNKEALRQLYLNNLLGINERRLFADDAGEFHGCIRGITALGQLVIQTELGERTYNMKEVQFLF